MSQPAYKRILLKMSGEVLAGEQSFGIDSRMIDYIASEIAEVAAMGVEVAVVIGGGNIFRGLDAADGGMERASADYRSEEHTSELQSRLHLVCRLLLEKKKNTRNCNEQNRN